MNNVPKRKKFPGMNRHTVPLAFIILASSLLILFIVDIMAGSVSIKPSEFLKVIFNEGNGLEHQIITRFRIPKGLTAIIAGISLSVSGLQMQTLFRNPMAGPYVLGISSGASLGVAMLVMGSASGLYTAAFGIPGNWSLAAAAWAGSAIVMILVYFISGKLRDVMTLLIIGIMLASGLSALVTILQYFSNESMLKAYVIWTMGSLGNVDQGQLNILIPATAAGLLISAFLVKPLNALQLGEDYAVSLGLNVKRSRILIFISTSILTGSVTAFCGPIGFIGIAVPHIVRMIFRTSDNRILLPAAILTGSIVMLFSDIVSQLPGSDAVLPINSVTAFIGIPVVIWIIMRTKRNISFL